MPENNLSGEFVLTPDKPKEEAARVVTPTPKEPVGTKVALETSDLATHNHEHKNMRFFSSLAHYPKNVVFQNQEADEEVVLVVRRDFITNLPWMLGLSLAAFIPILLSIIAPLFFPSLSISENLVVIATAFYYTILFGFVLLFFALWYFNVGIITNKRIVDLDVPNILVRHLSEARLNSIVDVSFSQVGGIRSFFDYGNVDIQTEALHQNIEFDRAPNPNFIRKVVGELIVEKPGV